MWCSNNNNNNTCNMFFRRFTVREWKALVIYITIFQMDLIYVILVIW